MEELLTSLQKFGAKKKQRGVLKDFISGGMISKIHNRDVLAQQGSDLVSSKPKIQTHDDGRPKLVSPEFVLVHTKFSYLLFSGRVREPKKKLGAGSLLSLDGAGDFASGLFDDI